LSSVERLARVAFAVRHETAKAHGFDAPTSRTYGLHFAGVDQIKNALQTGPVQRLGGLAVLVQLFPR
jgi:hypothetical protein